MIDPKRMISEIEYLQSVVRAADELAKAAYQTTLTGEDITTLADALAAYEKARGVK